MQQSAQIEQCFDVLCNRATVTNEFVMYDHMPSAKKQLVNIALSVIGIGVVLFYSLCVGACSYLKGTIFTTDLKHVGILYMVAFIIANILKRDLLILLLASSALGIEFYLIGFQVRYWTFCDFSLSFGAIVIAQFILSFDRSRKWYMVFGAIAGLLFFFFFFKGSVLPTFDFGALN
jgi:hypothetical protein